MHDVHLIRRRVIGHIHSGGSWPLANPCCLLDRGPTGNGTSWAAAGMLSPLSEANKDGPFFQLCSRSFSLYEGSCEASPTKRASNCGYSDNEGFSHSPPPKKEHPPSKWSRHMAAKSRFEVELISGDDVRKLEAARYGAGSKGTLYATRALGRAAAPGECDPRVMFEQEA